MKKLLIAFLLLTIFEEGWSQGVAISRLPTISEALSASDVMPIVHGGTTRQVTIAQIDARVPADVIGNIPNPVYFTRPTRLDSAIITAHSAINAGATVIASDSTGHVTFGCPGLCVNDTVSGAHLVTESYFFNHGWSLGGNQGTNPGANYIGTTDNKDLVFKLNNTERFRYVATGIGTLISVPNGRLTGYDSVNQIFFSLGNDPNLGAGVHAFSAGGFTKSGDFSASIVAPAYLDADDANVNQIMSVLLAQGRGLSLAVSASMADTISGVVQCSWRVTDSIGYKSLVVLDDNGFRYIDDFGNIYVAVDTFGRITLGKKRYAFPPNNEDSTGVLTNDGTNNLHWQSVSQILSALPSYANDSGAAGGGIPVGGCYYNTTLHAYVRRES